MVSPRDGSHLNCSVLGKRTFLSGYPSAREKLTFFSYLLESNKKIGFS